MISFAPVSNLTIVSVAGKGDLTKERVILQVATACDLGRYLVLDSTYSSDGISELNRHVFWFPLHEVDEGDYVLLYTKAGIDRTFVDRAGDTVHAFYWGMGRTIWNQDADAVTLVHTRSFSFKKV